MTTTSHARSFHRRPRPGFTLVEILVVIGIIVILAGVLVPLVGRAMRQAKQTRSAADMQAIASALENFKLDHGDYPRVEMRNTGAAVLGRFLFGPYGNGTLSGGAFDDQDPKVYTAGDYLPGDTFRSPGGAGDPTYVCVRPTNTGPSPAAMVYGTVYDWAPIAANDGVDGPGLNMRPGGKKYGPYLQEGKFKLRGLAVLDGNDNPILYFPARPGQGGDLTGEGAKPDNAYVYRSTATGASKATMKYDADDNIDVFVRDGETTNENALARIRALLGDYGNSGEAAQVIETSRGEKIATEAPFILWAAGADGRFGFDDVKTTNADADLNQNRTYADQCDDLLSYKK